MLKKLKYKIGAFRRHYYYYMLKEVQEIYLYF